MAPALRSVRRSWPFAKSGAVFEREAQGVMGARGRAETKVLGSREEGLVVMKRDHCWERCCAKWAFRVSPSRKPLWSP